MGGETTDTVSAKGDDVSCERASGVQDLSSDTSRQMASTSGAAHAAASGDGRRESHSSTCRWTLPDFTKTRARQVWSDFRTVAGRKCRLLVYPKGDSMALPGYISAYLQVDASARERASRANGGSTGNAADADWECFASYELALVRRLSDDDGATSSASGASAAADARRDSWHRFSGRKKSHGWCDFARSAVVLDPRNGYLVDDALTVEARIVFLKESSELVVEGASGASGASGATADGDVHAGEPPLTGRFTWTVENLSHFAAMVKTQKVMSPSFIAGDCAFRLSAYQSSVARVGKEKKRREDAEETLDDGRDDGAECLSLCLESREIDAIGGDKAGALSARTAALAAGAGGGSAGRVSKVAGNASLTAGVAASRSCWLVFRVSAVHQTDGKKSVHRDSYGRFAGDALSGDATSLGWNDFMPMATFAGGNDLRSEASTGFLEGPDGRAVFSVSFHAAREACEARTHHRRVDACSGPATVVLSPDGSVRAAGGGVPEASRATDAASRRKRGANDPPRVARLPSSGVSGKSHPFAGDAQDVVGRFVWRLDNFTRLKDILKKRKMSGLSVKSRRFIVGGRWCRLIVYPRGQSHPPDHLSVFLEVTDPDAAEGRDGAAARDDVFVSHRLSVCNQLDAKKSVSRESQNRYGRGAKDWGWREFLTLTTLFDEDAGYLVNDTVVFTAEVSVLRERGEIGSIPRDRVPLPTNQTRFNPRRLARFIARYGLEESEAAAARFLFGDRFEEVKAAALARAERVARRGERGAGKPKLELGALLAAEEDDARAVVNDDRLETDRSDADADADAESDSSDAESDADADLEDVHIQTPSPAQMAYVKTATDAKLPVASRLITERGMAPLEGEGVNVAFEWRIEVFAAFKDVLETRKITSRFFRAAPSVELRLGVYASWETLCVYLEPDSCVTGQSSARVSSRGGADDAARGAKNHWVRYRLGLVHQRDARKTVWKESSTCTRTRRTSPVSQLVKMHELMDPENGFVVKDTVVVACDVLDCCPWFDEREIGASAETAAPATLSSADGERDRTAAAAAAEAVTETPSSARTGVAGVAREGSGPVGSRQEEGEGASSKTKRRGGGGDGGGALADAFGGGGTDPDAFQSELLDEDLSRTPLDDSETLAEFPESAGEPSGLRSALSESLFENDLLRAALRSRALDADASRSVSSRSSPPSRRRAGAGPGAGLDGGAAREAEGREDDETKRRTAEFDRLFRAVGIEPITLSGLSDVSPERTGPLLGARSHFRRQLYVNPRERNAFHAAIGAFLSTRAAAAAAARECLAVTPTARLAHTPLGGGDFRIGAHAPSDASRLHLMVMCGCSVLRGVVYQRLLSSLLEACEALNEALATSPNASGNPAAEEALFDTRVLLGALTRLCDVAVIEANGSDFGMGTAEDLHSHPEPSEPTCTRLAQALNAPWPSRLKIDDVLGFSPRQILAACVESIVPRYGRDASPTARSLMVPLLEGALGGYGDDSVSTYFEALRCLDVHESDESAAFAKCVAAIETGSPRAKTENADSRVAELVDFAVFMAAKRDRRFVEDARASEMFAEVTRAALNHLERRGGSDPRDAWAGLDLDAWGDRESAHPVLDSVRCWMWEHTAVADVVAERLAATFVSRETPRAEAKERKREKTRAERRAAAREAAEREADARELAAVNAVVGKASFAGFAGGDRRRSDGDRDETETSADPPNADVEPGDPAEKDAAPRAPSAAALAPLAAVSFALSATRAAKDSTDALRAAWRLSTGKTFLAVLEAHPATARAARNYVRHVCLELDDGDFRDDARGDRIRVLGAVAVAAVLATRDETAAQGALAFVDALGACAERHELRRERDVLDGGDAAAERVAAERSRAAREYATLCDALAELLASAEKDPPYPASAHASGLLTRVLASAFAGGGSSFFARRSRAGDDDATLEALGAREDDATADECVWADEEAWAARRARALRGDARDDPSTDDASASTDRFVLDGGLAAARAAIALARRLHATREVARERREVAAAAAAAAEESARKLESDAAKLSRDKKTAASARAETELKAKREVDEARVHVSKLVRERDEAREKARDAERAGDWARNEANELRRAEGRAVSEREAAETRARDAEERMKRRAEEHRRAAERAKRRGDELVARLREAESRAREAERRMAEMEEREERRRRSEGALENGARSRLESAKLAETLAAERACAARAERELAETRAFFRDGSRLGDATSAGGVGAGLGAVVDGRRGLRAVVGDDAPAFGAPPGFAAFSQAPFGDANEKGPAAAPIGPPGEISVGTGARIGSAAPGVSAPFGGGSLFGLGGSLLGSLGNGAWSGDGDTWR